MQEYTPSQPIKLDAIKDQEDLNDAVSDLLYFAHDHYEMAHERKLEEVQDGILNLEATVDSIVMEIRQLAKECK